MNVQSVDHEFNIESTNITHTVFIVIQHMNETIWHFRSIFISKKKKSPIMEILLRCFHAYDMSHANESQCTNKKKNKIKNIIHKTQKVCGGCLFTQFLRS